MGERSDTHLLLSADDGFRKELYETRPEAALLTMCERPATGPACHSAPVLPDASNLIRYRRNKIRSDFYFAWGCFRVFVFRRPARPLTRSRTPPPCPRSRSAPRF